MGKIEQRMAKRRESMIAEFEAILARFERKYGEHHINFELFDYQDAVGLSYTHADFEATPAIFRRIAYKFYPKSATAEVCSAVMRHLDEWIKDPACPPGVDGDNVLVGNELDAHHIWLIQGRGSVESTP